MPINGSDTAFTTIFSNNTTVENQQNLIKTETSTQTFTWSVTEAVSVGVEISVTVGSPGEISVGGKITASFSLSSTQSQTITNSQTWSVSTVINVPAHTTVTADIVIGTQSYDINFTMTVMLNGYVAIWNKDKVNGHWLWFIPISLPVNLCDYMNPSQIKTDSFDMNFFA